MACLGAVSTGIGYSLLEDFFEILNISYMSKSTYDKYMKRLDTQIEKNSNEAMQEAAAEEKRVAEIKGDTCTNGSANISVMVDETWSKRSYGNSYSALSGAAVIVYAAVIVWLKRETKLFLNILATKITQAHQLLWNQQYSWNDSKKVNKITNFGMPK